MLPYLGIVEFNPLHFSKHAIMSNAARGQEASYPLSSRKSLSGFFFLSSFLLLIAIPASSYVEIWVQACLSGEPRSVQNGGMVVSPYFPSFAPESRPVSLSKPSVTGEEIAGETEGLE